MEAIIRDGGRQFRVKAGDTIEVDYRNVEPGGRIEFSDVLYIRDGEEARFGQPTVDGALVVGRVEAQVKDRKKITMRLRRRKSSRCRNGHRQPLTAVKIQDISLG